MAARLQSGMEMITTYGLLIFLVTLAIIIVVVLVSAPPATIPKSCSIYGGLECIDIAYGANALGGSTLLIRATFAVPGVLNISSFAAVLGSERSTGGYCTNNGVSSGSTSVASGGSILCLAFFPTNSTPSAYSGTFNVSADYCAGSSHASCPKGGGYKFAGTYTVQGGSPIGSNYLSVIATNATTTSISSTSTTSVSTTSTTSTSTSSTSVTSTSTIGYLTITLTNSNAISATPSNFQQMIPVPVSSYSPAEASDLGNIRFYLSDAPVSPGNELYSWCESNCTPSASGPALFWVLLPSGIPADSSVNLNMTFWASGSGSYEYDGVYAGEAPQLSPSYAEYDNGNVVFPLLYQDFAGTSVPSGWQLNDSLGAITIHNGVLVDLAAPGHSFTSILNTTALYGPNPNVILDVLSDLVAPNGDPDETFGYGFANPSGTSDELGWDPNGCAPTYDLYENAFSGACGGLTSPNGVYLVFSTYWPSANSATEIYGYSTNETVDPSISASMSIGLGMNTAFGTYPGSPQYTTWMRIRAYPPGGVMPSASFGTFN